MCTPMVLNFSYVTYSYLFFKYWIIHKMIKIMSAKSRMVLIILYRIPLLRNYSQEFFLLSLSRLIIIFPSVFVKWIVALIFKAILPI